MEGEEYGEGLFLFGYAPKALQLRYFLDEVARLVDNARRIGDAGMLRE